MSMCTSMLLGDSPPALSILNPPHPSAAVTINNVLRAHAPYWRSLRVQREFALNPGGHTNVLWAGNVYYSCLYVSVPESLRLSLPSPKAKGKRTSVGKSKKSSCQSTPVQSPRQLPQHHVSPEASNPPTATSGLDDLTQGMLSLDLNTSASSNPSPTSVPIGGARRKVKPQRDSAGPTLKVMAENTKDENGTTAITAPVRFWFILNNILPTLFKSRSNKTFTFMPFYTSVRPWSPRPR